jgi:hypothetical protein
MNELYITDKEIKIFFSEHFKKYKYVPLPRFMADFNYLINDTYYCFEYENSSRGMVNHISKYIYLADKYSNKNFIVNIIRSKQHQLKYNQDFELGEILLKHIKLNNLIINIYNCAGNVNDLKHIFTL